MKYYVLLFLISCFTIHFNYAQDTSRLTPSPLFNPAKTQTTDAATQKDPTKTEVPKDPSNNPNLVQPSALFNPAKVNEAGDPYFKGLQGQTDVVAWQYAISDLSKAAGTQDAFPRIFIVTADGGGTDEATYHGYDKSGAYITRNSDHKDFLFNGVDLISLKLGQKIPTNLYNNADKFYGKNENTNTPSKPQTVSAEAEPSIAVITAMAGGKFALKFKGGSDTTTHIIERPPTDARYWGQTGQTNTGMFVEKSSLSSAKPYKLYVFYAEGQHNEQPLTAQQYNEIFPQSMRNQHIH